MLRQTILLLVSLSALLPHVSHGWTFSPPQSSPTRSQRNISQGLLHRYQDMRWLSAPRNLGPDCPVSSMHNPLRPGMITNWTEMVNDQLGLFSTQDYCATYNPRKYMVQPVAAQQWWNKQKAMDQKKVKRDRPHNHHDHHNHDDDGNDGNDDDDGDDGDDDGDDGDEHGHSHGHGHSHSPGNNHDDGHSHPHGPDGGGHSSPHGPDDGGHSHPPHKIPQAPHFVTYLCCDQDAGPGLPAPDSFRGINVVILSFLEINGPAAKLNDFFKKTPQERRQWIDALHSRGITVLLSSFGGDPSQQAITMKYDPVALGRLHGQVVRESGLDGLDNDIEDFQASMQQNHDVVEWIVAYTRAVRREIPRGQYVLTTAPVAPWFTTNKQRYCSGLFGAINKEVGQEYDWYNVQFYNQGNDHYNDCQSILFKSNLEGFPDTSIFEISKTNNIPLNKLVIGKPAAREDATTGYVTTNRLSHCVIDAHQKGWNAGVMGWQWPNANSRWFQRVRGSVYPVN
ncbi:unnamed protein product [Sympodiomycopsis kandeliae]